MTNADLGGRSNDALAVIADAKLRICIYGSAEVIKMVNLYVEDGGISNAEKGFGKFLDIVAAMRRETAGGAKVEAQQLQNVIFGMARK